MKGSQDHRQDVRSRRLRTAFLAVLLCLGVGGAGAQPASFCDGPARVQSVDTRGLAVVYCTASPVVAAPLRWAHRSSYPVFYGALPASWAGALLRDDGDYTDAYRLTLTQVTTYGTVMALKRIVGRPRPYAALPLTSRSDRYADPEASGAFASFPSGHASLSVALATSWSLSHPRWYVIAPSALWAGAVTTSRLYLGVHYPSDVVTGALLGAGIATGIHLLRDALTPGALRPDDPTAGPTMKLRFRF